MMKTSLDHLVDILNDRNFSLRRRTQPLIKALAVKTYAEGLSFRRVAIVLKELCFKVSSEAVRGWFYSIGKLLYSITKRRSGFITVDETII